MADSIIHAVTELRFTVESQTAERDHERFVSRARYRRARYPSTGD